MLLVHAVPLKATLFERAKGFASVLARPVHEPERLLDVQERKYRAPSLPMASTMRRYWPLPVLYTFEASNRAFLESDRAMTVFVMPLGKLLTEVCER